MSDANQVKPLELIVDEDAGCATFVLNFEDHTLGNSMRHMMAQNPQVEFCGYSAPHPFDQKINIRVQTVGGSTAVDAFRQGLNDLSSVCDVVREKLDAAVMEYRLREGGASNMEQ